MIPQAERDAFHERGNVFRIDPDELIRDNPASLIINTASYQNLVVNFSVTKFDYPQVVRVATYAPEGVDIKLFVVDGMTRLRYVAENKKKLFIYPDFQDGLIPVRDITEEELKNPYVVYPQERYDGQNALTISQYLRDVIPPTVKHAEIALDRIAAHIINGWRNIAGEDLSARFSALSALSLLASRGPLAPSENMLRQFLASQRELMSGEHPEEREKLEEALLEIGSIIRQTRLVQRDIVEAAFMLVSSGSTVIGGERASLREITRLVRTPEIDKKLADAFPVEEREDARSHLIDLIKGRFKEFSEKPDGNKGIMLLSQSLRDPHLSYQDIKDLFTASDPEEYYKKFRQEINISNLNNVYKEAQRRAELTETESQVIDNICRREYLGYLDEEKIKSFIPFVEKAVAAIEELAEFQSTLVSSRDELVRNGVAVETIQDLVTDVSKAHGNLLASDSSQSIAMSTKAVRSLITSAEKRIAQEMNLFTVERIIEEVYEEEIKAGRGPLIRSHLALILIRDFDITNRGLIRQRGKDFKSLDPDLQSEVLNEGMRIMVAVRKQEARRSPPIDLKSGEIIRKQPDDAYTAVSGTRIFPSVSSQPKPESILPTKQDAEKERRSKNNARLQELIVSFISGLNRIDLDKDEVSKETLELFDQMLRDAGQFRFGHPDIVRLVLDTLEQIRRKIKIEEAEIQQQFEDAQKDTRTKQ